MRKKFFNYKKFDIKYFYNKLIINNKKYYLLFLIINLITNFLWVKNIVVQLMTKKKKIK